MLGWNNFVTNDVSHYMVYVNEENILNETNNINENMTVTAYRVCDSGPHQIGISAVDRCGREGRRSYSISMDQGEVLLSEPVCGSEFQRGNVTMIQPPGDQIGDDSNCHGN